LSHPINAHHAITLGQAGAAWRRYVPVIGGLAHGKWRIAGLYCAAVTLGRIGKQESYMKPSSAFVALTMAFLLLTLPFKLHAEARSFVSGSYQSILTARKGHPFLLILWSLECPSCLSELGTLAAARKRHPGLDLVIVSTDPETDAAKVEHCLSEAGLTDVEYWIFADAAAERLRFEIDPRWYGELPRAYFFDAAHRRHGVSGSISAAQLDVFATASAPAGQP
jgi:hypothetical protein